MESGSSRGRVKADINVTPLVDIVLVLLIIFIVITPAVNDAVRLPLAKHSVKPEREPGARNLSLMLPALRNAQGKVLGPGRILVDDAAAKDQLGNTLTFGLADEAERQRLRTFIMASVKSLDDKRVFVKADADLPFKYVHELFQLCREGGASEASIVTSEDKRPEGGE
jgi:biopolymer transport protein ExbD